MKRKLFIGSSTEGSEVASFLTQKITGDCGDWIEPDIWNRGELFSLNRNVFDFLIKASRLYEYGVLVATADDILKSRNKKHPAVRDNVLFETGLFLGSLGMTRAFMLVEKGTRMPSDYNGVIVSTFDTNASGSLEEAIEKVIKAISRTRESFTFKPIPSVALAVGYFENFIQPFATGKIGTDFAIEIILPGYIGNINTEIRYYESTHPSTEVSVYNDGTRPRIYSLKKDPSKFWDVPTTLKTLNSLMNRILPSSEIGSDPERMEWIQHELRNFKGTIESLVSMCSACRGKVTVLSLEQSGPTI